MSKRQNKADAKATTRAIAIKNKQVLARPAEQSYKLAAAKDQADVDACDDSPNLMAEFVLIRKIIQHFLLTDRPSHEQLPWLKLEESLARSIIAMGVQLSLLVPHTTLRDGAVCIAQAVDDALAIHAPDVRAKAVEWLKTRMGETLLDTDEETTMVDMPEAKQVYRFEGTASPNLSLGGSLKLMRWHIQRALDKSEFLFVENLLKQTVKTAQTQLCLAKAEGLLVTGEVSRRMSLEMTGHASACIKKFAPQLYDQIIDDVRERVMGPPKTTYRIEQQ